MEAVIEIPSPTPRDSETVVTALETAAIFRAKGDAAEALRWLQRAAESAGDDGDDERTLALARTAADLSRVLRHPASTSSTAELRAEPHSPPPSRRLPKPPLKMSGAIARQEELPPPQSTAHPALTPNAPSVTHHGPPPAPSSRPLPLSANGRPAYSQASASSRAPGPPPASRGTPPAQAYQPRYSSPSSAPAAAPSTPMPTAVQPPSTQVELRAADLPAFPTVETDVDPEAQRVTRPVPIPASHYADVRDAPKLRQAARVSVVHSSSEPGLFLVRLLDDGAIPPGEAAEALIVLVDPSSTLFSK